VLGRDRLQVLPVWEMEFGDLPAGAINIATARVKFDPKYQERRGIMQGPAEGLTPELEHRIYRLVKRICRVLALDGYARIDFRLSAAGVPYFIEANPNPEIARDEEFAEAALYGGVKYPDLLQRIVSLGIRRGTAVGA
jgi:D-alanine-D-alanine ligase